MSKHQRFNAWGNRTHFSRLIVIAVALVAMAAGFSARADLIGTQVTFGTLFKQTSASAPVVFSTTVGATVSASIVEFPSLSAYAIANNLGLTVVNGTVDVTALSLTETFQNAGSGVFATAFANDAVYTFTSAALVNIVGAVVNPISNLGLTNADLTFSGDQLFINYGGGQSFNPNSVLQIDLVVQGGPNGTSAAAPEPATLALLGSGLMALCLIRRKA
jgi:hypothetical protein